MGSTVKVNQFFPLVGSIVTNWPITYAVMLLTDVEINTRINTISESDI